MQIRQEPAQFPLWRGRNHPRCGIPRHRWASLAWRFAESVLLALLFPRQGRGTQETRVGQDCFDWLQLQHCTAPRRPPTFSAVDRIPPNPYGWAGISDPARRLSASFVLPTQVAQLVPAGGREPSRERAYQVQFAPPAPRRELPPPDYPIPRRCWPEEAAP